MTNIDFTQVLNESEKSAVVTYGQLAGLMNAVYKNLQESFENIEKEIKQNSIILAFIKNYLDKRYVDFGVKFEAFLKYIDETDNKEHSE